MLSRNAFNALLKTLEEPPAHVKFLFATTEVDKLPVTVLSRCQRFDLRRIPRDLLEKQFARICASEGVEAEAEALAIIASAAEGSSRDGLSILDQAIAYADLDADGSGGAKVSAGLVRDMLGLADRSALRRLFAALLEGDPQALIDEIDSQYALGVEPLALMRSLMDIAHRITVAQIANGGADAPTAEEREALEDWARRLAPGQLHRLWQLLLKGHDEVRQAPDPLVAAQMALLRVLHAADLPDPGKLAERLEEMVANGVAAMPLASASSDAPKSNAALDWKALVERIDHKGLMTIATKMRLQVRVVDLAPGRLAYALAPGFSEDISPELRDGLLQLTGERWLVELVEAEGAPTLVEVQETLKADQERRIMETPIVKAAFEAFPEAELVDEDSAAPAGKQWSRQ
jgi:DNA polymerase-3 subunit gamma/tau